MEIETIINELKAYCGDCDKKLDKEVFKSDQRQLLTGYIGSVINHIEEKNNYEVYLYIKDKESIVSPLLYKTFNDILSATNYYDEIIDLIENKSLEQLINRCKTGF